MAAAGQTLHGGTPSSGASGRPDVNGAALQRVRKYAERRDRAAPEGLLQWGRTSTSAETRPVARGETWSLALQWGRTPTSAEIPGKVRGLAWLQDASMGPHSNECGNSGLNRPGGPWQQRFNGAALQRVRKSLGKLRRNSGNSSFNGAALQRVRKYERRHDGAGSWPRFNGAALQRVRKSPCARR